MNDILIVGTSIRARLKRHAWVAEGGIAAIWRQMPKGAIASALLVLALPLLAACSQTAERRVGPPLRADCANLSDIDRARSLARVICSMPRDEFVALVYLARDTDQANTAALRDRIEPWVPENSRHQIAVIAGLFEWYGKQSSDASQIADEIATADARELAVIDKTFGRPELHPVVLALREAAAEATRVGLYSTAKDLNRDAADVILELNRRKLAALTREEQDAESNRPQSHLVGEQCWMYGPGSVPNATNKKQHYDAKRGLEATIEVYRKVLEEIRSSAPDRWAATQQKLGSALMTLGKQEGELAHVEEAVLAYRQALRYRTRERVPQLWVESQSSLGYALSILGLFSRNLAHLDDAVAAFRLALEEIDREYARLTRARVQTDLGITLLLKGICEGDMETLQQALSVLNASEEGIIGERGQGQEASDVARAIRLVRRAIAELRLDR